MKLQAIKNKVLAVALAVGLGVTGFSMSTQAAEVGTQEVTDCSHLGEIWEIAAVIEIHNLGHEHYVLYEISYVCADCGTTIKQEHPFVYEPHDYEQYYLENGKVMSCCTVCGEYYIWSL